MDKMEIDYVPVVPNLQEVEGEEFNTFSESERVLLTKYLSSYGETRDAWTPFDEKKIPQIIENVVGQFIDNSQYKNPIRFISHADSFDSCLGGGGELAHHLLDDINVYFVDVMTLYMNSFKHFENNEGPRIGSKRSGIRCCFIFSDALPDQLMAKVKNDFLKANFWDRARWTYERGGLHKFCYTMADLSHFINYIIKGAKTNPYVMPNDVYGRVIADGNRSHLQNPRN